MSTDSSELSTRNVFSLYSYVMTICGVWPLSENTLFLKSRFIFAVLEMISVIIIATVKLFKQCGSSEDIVDTVLAIVIAILINAKCIFLYINRGELASVVNWASKDWEIMKDQPYRRMMLKRAKFCNSLTKIFYSTGILVITVYILKNMVFDEIYGIDGNLVNGTSVKLQRGYILPYGCIFNDIPNFTYYFIILNQAIQMTILASINLAGDAFYVAITLHLCEQCEIMKLAFMKFGEYDSLEKNNNHLKVLIARHQNLMRSAEKLEDVYNGIIFIQMSMSVLSISFTGFNFLLSLNDGNIAGVAKNLSIMQFMLVQSYIYTFPADDLKDQAEGLLQALYSSYWFNMPINIKKNMIFMMMRMNVPPYYTAGKFFYMTRQSYMTVVKTAGSYLSVLRIMIK